jgi:hypothetical protein
LIAGERIFPPQAAPEALKMTLPADSAPPTLSRDEHHDPPPRYVARLCFSALCRTRFDCPQDTIYRKEGGHATRRNRECKNSPSFFLSVSIIILWFRRILLHLV